MLQNAMQCGWWRFALLLCLCLFIRCSVYRCSVAAEGIRGDVRTVCVNWPLQTGTTEKGRLTGRQTSQNYMTMMMTVNPKHQPGICIYHVLFVSSFFLVIIAENAALTLWVSHRDVFHFILS